MSKFSRWSGLISRLWRRRVSDPVRAKLLILVEGRHDVSFLTSISSMLQRHIPSVPDLHALEQASEVVFVPVGGGDTIAWVSRLAPLGLHEVHILDREMPPVTETRQQAASIVNLRPNCRAFVTKKRALKTICTRGVYSKRAESRSSLVTTMTCPRWSLVNATGQR
jgi:hypothetical protein